MAAPQSFRTAFNGFKREDVVQYIEYLNAKHTEQINQLTAENELLRQKLEEGVEQPDAEPAEQTDLSSRLSGLDEKLMEAANRIRQLEQERDAAIAERDAALAELNSAAQQTMQQCRIEQELEAYRRAERAERVAKERADQLYRKASGVLTEATARVDTVSGRVGTMADQVITQLEELKAAVSSSKLALQETAATLYTIRPADTEE